MNTRETLVAAALKILEQDGEAQFSTRAVCAIANVTAPTLYHHFGNADGLLSAAMAEAFAQFLASKKAATHSPDPETALRQGWDDYVRFAAARPLLYAAMMGRILQGARIPAAQQAHALLMERIEALAAEGRLAMTAEAAADLAWVTANAAALLFVTARLQVTTRLQEPDPAVTDSLRDRAMQTICKPRPKAKRA
jgi:AcrR family transcriptional regulator